MSSPFQIAKVRFFPKDTARDIETRLLNSFEERRRKVLGIDEDWISAVKQDKDWDAVMDRISPSREVRERMARRAQLLIKRREQASGMSHLGKDEKALLSTLKDGVRLVQLVNEHRADEIAATLHTEMPWMAEATMIAWSALREGMRNGAPALLSYPPKFGH